ncbi:uncharacterized protein N7515_001326 [Penicillium bovifimosum]|uniref:Uncharacterized protein n=1 Tax=Penicillium bovifimosum TaxID=126998 RepID=A0A9W9H9H0_9EURO|nr:uncharacterized protein N7515_001326 [Penicillium bovifimosum]KAJ5142539.1 hypothetical protein N7515_001326 [Penicillium bovifimosum]
MEPTNQVIKDDHSPINEGDRWHTQMALMPSLPLESPQRRLNKKRKRDSDGSPSPSSSPSPRPVKKRRLAFPDLHDLLVTYRGLQRWERRINRDLAFCRKLIAKHRSGSIFHPKYRPSADEPLFQRVRSPLCEETYIDALEDTRVEALRRARDRCLQDYLNAEEEFQLALLGDSGEVETGDLQSSQKEASDGAEYNADHQTPPEGPASFWGHVERFFWMMWSETG